MRLKSYFGENWGAPFVIAFMILLVISAVELSLGSNDAANGIAVYAFSALVIGTVMQMASCVDYRKSKPALEPLPRLVEEQKLFATSRPATYCWDVGTMESYLEAEDNLR